MSWYNDYLGITDSGSEILPLSGFLYMILLRFASCAYLMNQ